MKKDSIVIDTNLLLDDHEIIYKLSKEYDKIILPITVLKELDSKKFNRDLSYSARHAIRAILEFKNTYPDKIKFTINDNEASFNDLKIIEAAALEEAAIATKDISMSILAEAKGIDTKLYGAVSGELFNPYVDIDLSDLFLDKDCLFSFEQSYEENKYFSLIEYLSNKTYTKLDINTWFFLLINNTEEIVAVYANNPLKCKLERIDNINKYRKINTDGNTIKALDEYQNCAIYAMKEAPNVIITGKWGSGKTLLSTAYVLAKRTKAFITRPPVGINKAYDIGFLPGNLEEKMIGWFAGFMSSLYYIYANTRGQHDENDNQYDIVKDIIFKKKFETVPINAIQGMSLLDSDILIADEIQLIDVNYLSMILSRSSLGSKIILLGDLSQTYSVVKPSESGLLKLLQILPHSAIAHVDLKKSHRSNLIEVADKLQDKIFG